MRAAKTPARDAPNAVLIPPSLKMKGFRSKWILKKVMEEYLPRDVIYRSKVGFGMPIREWFNNELRDWLNDILSKDKLKKNGLIGELKCVWSKPDPLNKRILKQVLRYKKNSTKDCMLCFLNVITDSKGKFVNAFCYWFSVNHHKK